MGMESHPCLLLDQQFAVVGVSLPVAVHLTPPCLEGLAASAGGMWGWRYNEGACLSVSHA